MKEPLTVECAAIMQRGIMFVMPRPFRHGHIFRGIYKLFGTTMTNEQGFRLSDGSFATRQYAMSVAFNAKQIDFYPSPTQQLFSEDLW